MRFVFAVFAVIAVALAGAVVVWRVSVPMEVTEVSSPDVTLVSGNGSSRLEVGGVTYLLPAGPDSRAEIVTRTPGRGHVSFDNSYVSGDIKNGNLTINGKNIGVFQAGDEVDLREKGKVLVNGEER